MPRNTGCHRRRGPRAIHGLGLVSPPGGPWLLSMWVVSDVDPYGFWVVGPGPQAIHADGDRPGLLVGASVDDSL